MPKTGQKRRRPRKDVAPSDGLFNLTGLSSSSGLLAEPASLDNCLEELEGAFATSVPRNPSVLPTAKKQKLPDNGSATSDPDRRLWNPSLAGGSVVTLSSQDLEKRVSNWNSSFDIWATTGKYTHHLLPSFDVEVCRHFQVKELSSFLLKSCPKLKMPSFERWLIDSKVEERNNLIGKGTQAVSDPVLGCTLTVNFESSQRLISEIVDACSIEADDAKKTVLELCQRTTRTAAPQIHAELRRCAKVNCLKKDKISVENHESSVSLLYHKKRWKKPFCVKVNRDHYNKLKEMFASVHSECRMKWIDANGKATRVSHAFHLILMVLVLRYSSLSGGQLLNDLRGGGMQGAIHGEVFDVLRDVFSQYPLFECFASPFNAYLPHFGSAFFEDIDWHFGSTGDFLLGENGVFEGCLEANPPFSPGLMDSMVDRIMESIKTADSQNKFLTYAVIVPTGVSSREPSASTPIAKRFASSSFKKMISSAHCRIHIVLSARDHGYIEGAQHVRPTRFKDSSYDTSVILLQSQYAMSQDLCTDFEEKIRQSFISRHSDEIAQRRKILRSTELDYE